MAASKGGEVKILDAQARARLPSASRAPREEAPPPASNAALPRLPPITALLPRSQRELAEERRRIEERRVAVVCAVLAAQRAVSLTQGTRRVAPPRSPGAVVAARLAALEQLALEEVWDDLASGLKAILRDLPRGPK